ncbi:MAG: sulfurtransferase [Candidatus Tectomicrobia bacterium]|uniref:Sulfurtransferase n=1 Tax=Tectimicrobiota bacterium TaxID=2528274 RepID=A0A932MNP4_UNCTE|nr:sulfurtransferase [Candidatus Tectomicrobia bacterium]
MATTNYAHPEVLASTDWVAQHGKDPNVRLVEVDVDTSSYEKGHIEGAVGVSWDSQLTDQVRRDLLSNQDWEKLLSDLGISNNTTIVAYGDNNNWFAAWFVWQLKYYGHGDARLMDGGRVKWLKENRPLTTGAPKHPAGSYKVDPARMNKSFRAYRRDVEELLSNGKSFALVDVRSPDEYTGKILAPPGLNETCQRGGHIPGAANIPWGQAVKEDGSFKPREELEALYKGKGVTPDKPVVAYCRIGERSSHSWFVLKFLLGYDNVRNYDGSWTEWGNLVGAPVAKGPEPGKP